MIKKLKEQRGAAMLSLEELRTAVADGGKSMTKEQREKLKDLTEQIDGLDAQIDLEQRSETERKKALKEDKSTDDAAKAVTGSEQEREVKRKEGFEAFRAHLRTGEVRAALQESVNGQYLIPSSIASTIEVALKSYGGVMSVCNIVTTATGAPINFPSCNDTAEEAVIMEVGAEMTETGDIAISNITIGAYTFRIPAILLSRELLQDSAFDLESFVKTVLSERFARGLNRKLTLGTGEKEPKGVVPAAYKPATLTAAADAITYDNLIDLTSALDAAYKLKAVYMFNSQTLGAIQKLTDASGRHIFQPSASADTPDTVLGKPYVLNDQMDGIGAGKASVLFGNFDKYMLRLVSGVEFVTMREVYARFNSIGIMGFARADANLIDAGTHPIVKLVHAAL